MPVDRLALALAVALLSWWPAPPARAAEEVDPAELTRNEDLIGREVIVDDRLVYFQEHRGRGLDEITLKRSGVIVRVPPRLRPKQQPVAKTIRIRGTVVREGNRWYLDVASWEGLPSELDRIAQAVKALAPDDAAGRRTWSKWAQDRGLTYRDDELIARSRELAVEALRIEAELPGTDLPDRWIKLAREGRAQGVEEPEPSSLVHRAFRERLRDLTTVEELDPIPGQIAELLPNSREPRAVEPSAWDGPYQRDPMKAYRSAPAEVRRGLDRRLLADAWQRLLELKAKEQPADALKLADQAESVLSDRPEVAAQLRRTGIDALSGDLGSLRQDEVEAIAGRLRVELGDPERARKLVTDWLADRRTNRLGRTDSEGRINLARSYEAMLGDRETAAELLREASEIDPESKAVSDAFRRLGFSKVEGRWVSNRPQVPSDAAPSPSADGGLSRGMTREQVQAKLGGKPDRVSRSATQGQLIEQWIFQGPDSTQVINFLRRSGAAQATVVDYYTIR